MDQIHLFLKQFLKWIDRESSVWWFRKAENKVMGSSQQVPTDSKIRSGVLIPVKEEAKGIKWYEEEPCASFVKGAIPNELHVVCNITCVDEVI